MDKLIKNLKAAMALQGLNADEQACYKIILSYDKVKEVGDQFSLSDASEIEALTLKKFAEVKEPPKKEVKK